MENVNPATLEKIYKLLTKSKKQPSLNELKRRFCPNTSNYKNKMLIRLFHIFDDTGVFLSNEILTVDDFRMIDWDEKIQLGSVNGENTDVYLTLNDMIVNVFEDPYIIYTFVETHGDLVVEGCGYLDKFISDKKKKDKKKSEKIDEFSEEESEEETDSSEDDSESD
jgi:hypothetical protein